MRYYTRMLDTPASLYDRIYAAVRAVPSGRVTTSGTIGFFVGCPARVVGYALHHLQGDQDVPWQRVINARGGISTHGAEQRQLLEAEGVVFDDQGHTDLGRWGWEPGEGEAGKYETNRQDAKDDYSDASS